MFIKTRLCSPNLRTYDTTIREYPLTIVYFISHWWVSSLVQIECDRTWSYKSTNVINNGLSEKDSVIRIRKPNWNIQVAILLMINGRPPPPWDILSIMWQKHMYFATSDRCRPFDHLPQTWSYDSLPDFIFHRAIWVS